MLFFPIENVINHTDEEGFTPLMWAAAHGQIAVVEFLLQNVRKMLSQCACVVSYTHLSL
jgi:ankyrin repeat protein